MFVLPFFVEVVQSLGLLLVAFVFSVVGAVLFGALVLHLCFSLLVHGMPLVKGWVDLMSFV